MVAENFNAVAFFAGYSGYVNHCYVHTNVANVRSFLPINQTVGVAIAQMAVQSVGITNGDGGDETVALEAFAATVTHGLAGPDAAQLENGGAQSADVVKGFSRARVDAIEA